MTSSNELLIKAIENRVDNREPIPDMVLDDLLDRVAEACREIYAPIEDMSSSLIDETLDIADSAFGDLIRRLNEVFVYDLYDDMTSGAAFSIGACWGGVTTAQKCEEHRRDSEQENEEQRFVKEHLALFEAIESNPGSCHHEIAQALGVSDPRLTQIVKDTKPYQLISTSIRGRSKHYYLTRKGKERYCAHLDECRKTSYDDIRPHFGDPSGNANAPGIPRKGFVLEEAGENANMPVAYAPGWENALRADPKTVLLNGSERR